MQNQSRVMRRGFESDVGQATAFTTRPFLVEVELVVAAGALADPESL